MQNLHPTIRNLVKDERGNVLMTFGLASMIAVAAVGGSIDYGRAVAQKAKMQHAMDAAIVTAVAKYRQTNDWAQAETEAGTIFQSVFSNATVLPANAPASQKQQAITSASLDQPVVQFTNVGGSIQGSAQVKVNSPFMRLVTNTDLQTMASSTGSPPTGKQLEVAVMVDLTGSMGWSAASGATAAPCSTVSNPQSKIDFLRCAGEDLLNILLPSSGANNSTVRVGIAPFSDKVNAGEYAAAVTGLAATGGTYANISNLAWTKQGPFSGTYSGAAGTGSQYGAQGSSNAPGATTTTQGATYSNSYCATPTTTTNVAIRTAYGYRVGIEVERDHNTPSLDIPGIITQTSGGAFKRVGQIDGSGSDWWNWLDLQDGSDSYGYFVPLPENPAVLTPRSRTANSSGYSRTGNIGVAVSYDNDMSSSERSRVVSLGFKQASGNSTGYWKLTQIDADGNHDYTWTTSGWYLPLFESLSSTTTTVGCESAVVAQPTSKLITCVTERKNGTALDYTAETIVAGRYVGPYNHGSTSKSNYSSDGKCWAAGRELAPVIPLTNDRNTLETFFETASVGGATAGHLGTAWASYLLSPHWTGIWPAVSAPAAYNSTAVKKAAILMTDGEYNIQFSTGTDGAVSSKQALKICQEMRSQGIHIYTIGFGFAENATPPTTNIEGLTVDQRTTPLTSGTAQQKALDTLAKCASSNSSYYFPYDGQALREVFKSIASGLVSETSGGSARLTQ